MADVPARFDRGQLERIIRRAAELQTGEHEIADELSREEILRLGREVGIPARYLEQAIVEEGVRTPEAALEGFWDRLAGQGAVRAMRVVRGDAESAQRALVRWMEEQELLGLAREQPGKLLWEPVGGLHAAVRRSVAAVGGSARPFMLGKVQRVWATVTSLEAGYCHILLEADLRQARAALIGGGAAVTTIGLAFSAVLTVLHAFLPLALLPLPIGAAVGYAVLRRFPPVVERTQLGLERALDAAEQGAATPPGQLPPARAGLLEGLLGEVKRVLK